MLNAGQLNDGQLNGFGGFGIVKELAGRARVSGRGFLFPYDVIMSGAADVLAVSENLTVYRLARLKSVANVGLSTNAPALHADRIMAANATALMVAGAGIDATVGGVRYGLLSGHAAPTLSSTVTIDPQRYASGKSVVSAYASAGLGRVQRLLAIARITGGVTKAAVSVQRRLRGQSSVASVVASSTGAFRFVKTGGAADVVVSAVVAAISATRKVRGQASVSVSTENPAMNLSRLISGSAKAVVSIYRAIAGVADKLYGRASASISSQPASIIRTGPMSGEASAIASAGAFIEINRYELEPDFRTMQVDPGDWTAWVEKEDWTFQITDDDIAMKTFEKQPADVLGYDIDFTEWFEQIPTDEVDTSSCVVESATDGSPSNLSVDSVVNIQSSSSGPVKIVKVWLSGGIDGVTYKLTLTIVTKDGRTKEQDFKLKVKEE